MSFGCWVKNQSWFEVYDKIIKFQNTADLTLFYTIETIPINLQD